MTAYLDELRKGFGQYRDTYFTAQSHLFEPRAEGGPVVFNRESLEHNLIVPQCGAAEREHIVSKIAPSKRHRHFGSMQSSQALAQSVFGSIEVLGRLSLLSDIKAEDGLPAFGSMLGQTKLEFEKEVQTLGERPGHATSVDVLVSIAPIALLSSASWARLNLEPVREHR